MLVVLRHLAVFMAEGSVISRQLCLLCPGWHRAPTPGVFLFPVQSWLGTGLHLLGWARKAEGG